MSLPPISKNSNRRLPFFASKMLSKECRKELKARSSRKSSFTQPRPKRKIARSNLSLTLLPLFWKGKSNLPSINFFGSRWKTKLWKRRSPILHSSTDAFKKIAWEVPSKNYGLITVSPKCRWRLADWRNQQQGEAPDAPKNHKYRISFQSLKILCRRARLLNLRIEGSMGMLTFQH